MLCTAALVVCLQLLWSVPAHSCLCAENVAHQATGCWLQQRVGVVCYALWRSSFEEEICACGSSACGFFVAVLLAGWLVGCRQLCFCSTACAGSPEQQHGVLSGMLCVWWVKRGGLVILRRSNFDIHHLIRLTLGAVFYSIRLCTQQG